MIVCLGRSWLKTHPYPGGPESALIAKASFPQLGKASAEIVVFTFQSSPTSSFFRLGAIAVVVAVTVVVVDVLAVAIAVVADVP